MIVFTESAEPALRSGEFDLSGRRVAVRATPYSGQAAAPHARFDPFERRFVIHRRPASVAAGPSEPEAWREALQRLPAGAVAVEAGAEGEALRGAFRAAAVGARAAGRGVYLIDPEPEGLPAEADASIVVVLTFRPLPLLGGGGDALRSAVSSGFAAGLVLPVIPGWTDEASVFEPLLDRAQESGAAFLSPVLPAADGEARRLAVEARAAAEPEAAERFFDQAHHADWSARLPGSLEAVRRACARRGLATLPPRAVGWGEPRVNARAAADLEERAIASDADEHRQALLHAAVRWIDEAGRDLGAVAREGNFRKVFPFGAEIAGEAEAALVRRP
jgi:hypothetical protein